MQNWRSVCGLSFDSLSRDQLTQQADVQDMRKRKAGLEVKDRGPFGTVVPGALAVKVRSVEQSLGLLKKGNQHRAVRHTEMNQHSSRSHTILQAGVGCSA